MKLKIVFIICILSLFIEGSMLQTHALPTKIPAQTVQDQEEQQSNNIFDILISFVSGVFNRINNQPAQPFVSSQNITKFSDTIKEYESVQQINSQGYENSHEKEKLDFGTGFLDLISGILKFFGM